MFTERKIEKFQQTVSALPDTPNLSAVELKRRFDACPEELRQALNGVCDDGAALEKRMDAYCAQTFEGEITRAMLAPAVQNEISGKAEQSALDAAETRVAALETDLARKCEVYFGTYQGDGKESQTITLSFAPKWILIFNTEGCGGSQYNGGLAFQDQPCELGKNEPIITLSGDKLTVYNKAYGSTWARTNFAEPFCYLMGR